MSSNPSHPNHTQSWADKQGAFVGEGTPHDVATVAGCSAYETTEPAQAGAASSIPARSTNHTPRYDIMRHGNDGYGVVCNIDGVFENAIPFDAYRDAELFLEELEEREMPGEGE